jgi:hypothetical protein
VKLEEAAQWYSSPGIIRMMKSRSMRLARRIAHMGGRVDVGFRRESQKDRDHYAGLNIGVRIILKWTLK